MIMSYFALPISVQQKAQSMNIALKNNNMTGNIHMIIFITLSGMFVCVWGDFTLRSKMERKILDFNFACKFHGFFN